MGEKEHIGKNKSNNKVNQTDVKKKRVIGLIGFIIILAIAVVLFNQNRTGDLFGFGKKEIPAKQQAKEYDDYAGELLEPIKVEMAKPVSVYKFMLNSIEQVETLLWKGLDLDTTLATAWEKLGYINAQFHGRQALLRYESFKNQGMEEKMLEEEKNAIVYFAQADVYYDQAIESGHAHPDRIYYQKAEASFIQYNYEVAAINLLKAVELNPEERMYKARLIDAYLYAGKFNRALTRIEVYRREYPESELPYRNLGSYYLFQGDTSAGIRYYMEAVEKGTKPEVGKLLYKYFSELGDKENADYYLQKAHEAEVSFDPEKY